jgi:phosphoribosylanthranilate isomerase
MFVKICGLTEQLSLDAAVAAGADAVGFVFAESVREIDPAAARRLCRELPASVLRIAVMHHPSPERVSEVIDVFAPDWLQTDADDLVSLTLPPAVSALPVYREGDSLPRQDRPRRLLFEGRVSGSGETADWEQARRFAAETELILAGGLNADNVGRAIAAVKPFGVDVSSGVESARGVKDPRKIREFVARVRSMEEEQ